MSPPAPLTAPPDPSSFQGGRFAAGRGRRRMEGREGRTGGEEGMGGMGKEGERGKLGE